MKSVSVGIFGPAMLLLLVLSGVLSLLRGQVEVSEEESKALEEFTRQVKEYGALRERLDKGLPPLKDKTTPEEIFVHSKVLSKRIQEARAEARQGDFFTPSVTEALRRIIGEEIGANPAEHAAIVEADPSRAEIELNGAPKTIQVEANTEYPEWAPLTTVPPQLLLRLPLLVEEVEYRFVHGHLILRDARANLIIDYVPGVLSTGPVRLR